MDQTRLLAISPVDGRYAAAAEPLRALFCEAGLIRERIRVEALWLLELAAAVPQLRRRGAAARRSPRAPPHWRAIRVRWPRRAVKDIEARIKHDVKAVEYFVRAGTGRGGAPPRPRSSWCILAALPRTSTISATRGSCPRRARRCCCRSWRSSSACCAALRASTRASPMLARTHGQSASPTTLGKEYANVAARLQRAQPRLRGGNPGQVERRGRQFQCASGRSARRRLARHRCPLRRRPGTRAGMPTRRRSSRTTGSASTRMPAPRSTSC